MYEIARAGRKQMRERFRISQFRKGKDMSEEIIKAEAAETPESTGEKKEGQEDKAEKLKNLYREIKEKSKEAIEAMREGKGRMRLETPIKADDAEIAELVYDFTALTGIEYTNAMDSDPNARQAYKITYRQGLALFAAAAAKQTKNVDSRDIVERIGLSDAVEGVQLATSFFVASTKAGQLRISKK